MRGRGGILLEPDLHRQEVAPSYGAASAAQEPLRAATSLKVPGSAGRYLLLAALQTFDSHVAARNGRVAPNALRAAWKGSASARQRWSSCRRIQLSSALKELIGVRPGRARKRIGTSDSNVRFGPPRQFVRAWHSDGAGADSAAIERPASTSLRRAAKRWKARGRLRCSAVNALVADGRRADGRSTDAPATASIGSLSSRPL
jgi:hypothetical protein